MQNKKLYTGWFDATGKPHVEANDVPLPIIPCYTDPEADLAITMPADYFDEEAPLGTLLKCVFYAPDFRRDVIAGLSKDQHW